VNIAFYRLSNLQIAKHRFETPGELVAWLGAIQAQDFPGAKWSIGLRLPGATEPDIDRAIKDRTIVRTWLMRGTLHFVAAEDVHWMRAFLAAQLIAKSTTRQRNLELDAALFARCENLFSNSLRGGRQLSRDAMCALLEKAGISTTNQRGYHILWRMAQEGLLCFGIPAGKQPTFVLLDEWCPASKGRSREESLMELTKRYFTSHGPATLQDYVGWSGLKVSDARAGLEMLAPSLAQEVIANKTHWMPKSGSAFCKSSATAYLLPGFDEYILGYKDRSASLDPKYAQRLCPGSNGMFIPTIVMGGQVVGTWKRKLKKNTVAITPNPFAPFDKAQKTALDVAAERYGKFVGKKSD
jgi:hypothetical protein